VYEDFVNHAANSFNLNSLIASASTCYSGTAHDKGVVCMTFSCLIILCQMVG
jgi:hypothetical protein